MELIFDILFDLIVEGSIGAVGDKKVPMPLRIIAAVFLILVFGTLVAVCLYIGISEKNWIGFSIAGLIIVVIIGAVWKTIKRHRRM